VGQDDRETAATIAVVDRRNDAFNRHDGDAVMTLMSGDRCVVRWRHQWDGANGGAGNIRGVALFWVAEGKAAENLAYVEG
jgi:hypothetical protein